MGSSCSFGQPCMPGAGSGPPHQLPLRTLIHRKAKDITASENIPEDPIARKSTAEREARLRLKAEANQMAMRAVLESARRTARERIGKMVKRVELEEAQCSGHSSALELKRERIRRDFEQVLRDQAKAKTQVSELEDAVCAADGRCHKLERLRKSHTREIEGLRSELRAHRSRATRCEVIRQKVAELEQDLR